MAAEGSFHVIYFIAIIFFGSFYLINLILAILALSYNEQQANEAREAAAEEAEIQDNQNRAIELKRIVDFNDEFKSNLS